MLLSLFLSLPAFACLNLIDRGDVEKMVRGEPHGKQVLGCTTKDCVCIDGIDLETADFQKGNLVQNEEKKATKKALAEMSQLKRDQDRLEALVILEKIEPTVKELQKAIKTLLPDR